MNIKEENICRLCLNTTENDLKIIDEIKRKMIEDLSLKVNLDISKDPVICKDCTEILIKCYNFKSACSVIEKLGVDKKIATFQLQEIKDEKDVETINGESICRFCSKHSSEIDFVFLNTLMNNVVFAEMLQALLPQTNIYVIKNSVICTTCKQSLEYYIKFVENCWDVEEKINKYCQNEGVIPSSARVKLSEIKRFYYQNIVQLDGFQSHWIKREVDALDYINETHSEVYDDKLVKPEVLCIKSEVDFNETARETPSVVPIYKINIPCEVKIETEIKEASAENSSNTTTNYGEYNECDNESQSNTIPLETGVNVSQPRFFKCTLCTYATKLKGNLKKHTLIHKDTTEIEMFKCSTCAYETKREGSLKRHTLIHKDVTEIRMYKCPTCTFQAKQKASLKRHASIHKDVTEVEMHKCSTCTFQARQKGSLKRHMLVHKDVTEVAMYKCSSCTFQAKHKCTLKRHLLIHKDVTEVEMYNCSTCSFRAKQKASLKRHMLIHKNITEVEVYKCSTCTYQTKRKGSLVTHLLIHRNVADVEMFKCAMCSFQTKHKGNLKSHTLIHKDRRDELVLKDSISE